MTLDPVEVVKRFYDGLNAHDANAVVGCFKTEPELGTWDCPAVPNTLRGDQIASFVQSMIAAIPDLKWEVASIERLNGAAFISLTDPPDVFIGAIWSMDGGFGTEFRTDLLGADVFRIAGEQISCMEGLWNSARLPSQLKSHIIDRLPQK